ncbi:MAG: hypothetical protein R3F19_18805 [Verrucomicrobiales bacterium]
MKKLWAVSWAIAFGFLIGGRAAAGVPSNEEEWIVAEVATYLNRVVSLASAEKPGAMEIAADGEHRFKVTGGRLSAAVDVELKDHIWDPDGFASLTKSLMVAGKLKAAAAVKAAGDAPQNPVAVLTTPTAENLQELNERLSKALRQEPGSAELHRQAAFLLGAFALRENSGHFHDTRVTLSHMAAHMALAAALDSSPEKARASAEGRLLPALLDVLTGREKLAAAALSKRDNATTPEAAWRRALDLHVRMDWRAMGGNKTKAPGTLLEQLEFFRAVTNCVSPDSAIARMREWTGEQEMVPDWSRIVLKYDCSVQTGHFCSDFLSSELRDAAITTGFTAEELDAAAMKRFATVLNTAREPKSGDPFYIITVGDWAQHSQRHLMQFTLRQIPWMEKSWGVQEAADQFMDSLAPFLTNLTLFPLVGFECWSKLTDQQKEASAKKAAMLATAEPWTVVARRWKALENEGLAGAALPAADKWFTDLVPFGTQYNAYNRRLLAGADMLSGEDLAKARAMAPYDPILVNYRAGEILKSGGSVAQLLKEAGDLPQYNAGLARMAAEFVISDPEAYIKAMRTVVSMQPDYYGTLAGYFLERGRIDEAMQCYQSLIDEGNNSIRASNMSGLLMSYYLEKGQKEKAKAVAEFSADVYSYRGLVTMIDYCIAAGAADEALDWAKKLDERYDDINPTMVVCGQFPKFAKEEGYADFMKNLFPDGLKKVTLASFKGEPDAGTQLAEESNYTRSAKITLRDVIVAVQGFKVDNQDQYTYARDLNPALKLKLILWDGKSYREIEAIAPNRRFGVELTDYSKGR